MYTKVYLSNTTFKNTNDRTVTRNKNYTHPISLGKFIKASISSYLQQWSVD